MSTALLNTCPNCVLYEERLNAKAIQCKVLHERIEVLESKVQHARKEKDEVLELLENKMTQLSDSAIKIRNLEEQLQSAINRGAVGELSRAEVADIVNRDLEHIRSQLVEKDMKIMELCNTILEKERHILDLQEMFGEQGELVQAKSKAFHIIQKKLLDLNSRTTCEHSTETEATYFLEFPSTSTSSTLHHLPKDRRDHRSFNSPGHAVVHLKMCSSNSPPPVDPSEEHSSITQDTGIIQDEDDADDASAAFNYHKKKPRKKVTFDLPPRKELSNGSGQEVDGNVAQAIIDLTTENDQLRQTIQEMDSCANNVQIRVKELQTQLDEVCRDRRNQILKARASMQGRIRDLEDKITSISLEHSEKVEHLNASIEMLRADREWILEENARQLEVLNSYKEKLSNAWEAVTAEQTECARLRLKLDNDRALVVRLADDLEETKKTASTLLEQKILILDDVERLKEALEAQDEYIELLEADTVIYEEHIGLLRDSLGASKIERRALIKSKAFEAKLKALEQEKEQMSRRSNDEKLHIKALNLKISSLEENNAVLIARNDELESRLSQLNGSANIAAFSACSAAEVVSSSPSQRGCYKSGTIFKVQASNETGQWPKSESVAVTSVCQNYCGNENMVSDMQSKLDVVRAERSAAEEKVILLGCINFELENQLKDVKEKLRTVEIRKEESEQHATEVRRKYIEQMEQKHSLETDFNAKLVDMEAKMKKLREELALKDEQLEVAIAENSKWSEQMKQWKFAVSEVEALHLEFQRLEKQLCDEKAAMESKWSEVRTILLERNDTSWKTLNAEPLTDEGQRNVDQIEHSMNAMNGWRNTVKEPSKILDKPGKWKSEAGNCEADKTSCNSNILAKSDNGEEFQSYKMQIMGLQRQLDFMDHEVTRLYALKKSKDGIIKELQTRLHSLERNQKQEFLHADDSNEHSKQQQQQQQVSVPKNEVVVNENAGMTSDGTEESKNVENETEMKRPALTVHHSEFQKLMFENEALKMRCDELTKALHCISGEMERRNQEKDDIIEMLQSQHTYLTQTILYGGKHEKQMERETQTIVFQIANRGTITESREMQSVSVNTVEVVNADIMLIRDVQMVENFTQTPTLDYNSGNAESGSVVPLIEVAETGQESSSKVLFTVAPILESKSLLAHQCVGESNRMQNNLTVDITQLMVLNAELETAVEVLKGEIWSLNRQLTASITVREDLTDKLCELSQRHEEEIERARERERHLEEQKDMAEKSQRQAALAENESNRRLVEWQEKSAEMERNRLELENAYAQLSEYYRQIQQAYNALYARTYAHKFECGVQTTLDGRTVEDAQEVAGKVEFMKGEMEQRKMQLEEWATQLRNLISEQLFEAMRTITDLRKMNAEMEDLIAENKQAIQIQLQEVSKEILVRIQKAFMKWGEERKLEDLKIVTATNQLLSGVLTEDDFAQVQDLSLSAVVDIVIKKYAQKHSETVVLRNSLRNERNDKVTLEMKMQQAVFENDERSATKVKELEELLQSTQLSLDKHVVRCQELQARLDWFGSVTNRNSPAAGECDTSGGDSWKCSTPCTICRELMQTKQSTATPPQLQLAILAARLTTKIADNDAMFRCNAELAQKNLELQNETDKLKEQIARLTTTADLNGAIKTKGISLRNGHFFGEKVEETEKKRWDLGTDYFKETEIRDVEHEGTVPGGSSLQWQATGIKKTEGNQLQDTEDNSWNKELRLYKQLIESLETKFHAVEDDNLGLTTKNKKLESDVERLERGLRASEQHCLELQTKHELLAIDLEMCQRELLERRQKMEEFEDGKLEMNQTSSLEELNRNGRLPNFIGDSNLDLEELRVRLGSAQHLHGKEGVLPGAVLDDDKEKEGDTQEEEPEAKQEEENDWDWDITNENLHNSLEEQVRSVASHDISSGFTAQIQNFTVEMVLLDKGTQTVATKEFETILTTKIQLLEELQEQLQEKEAVRQELETKNNSFYEEIEKQRHLIENLGEKLDKTEKYNMELEAKCIRLERELMEQEKKCEDLMIKSCSAENAKCIMGTKMQNELTILKQENESLNAQIVQKQAFLNAMETRLANLQQQSTDDQNTLKIFKKKLRHVMAKNNHLQLQLDNCKSRMNEKQQDVEVLLPKNEDKDDRRGVYYKLDPARKELQELKLKCIDSGQQGNEHNFMDSRITCNEKLNDTESGYISMECGIFDLKTEGMAQKREFLEKPAVKSISTMTDASEELKESSEALTPTAVDGKDYIEMRKKMESLRQKFETARNKTMAEHADTKQKERSALKKLFEPESQRSIKQQLQHVNDDKLRRRRGRIGTLGAESSK